MTGEGRSAASHDSPVLLRCLRGAAAGGSEGEGGLTVPSCHSLHALPLNCFLKDLDTSLTD